MRKFFLILAVMLLASPAWGAEKKAEPKGQTAKIVVDVANQAEKKEVVVQTTQKKRANLSGNAQANRLKR